MPKWDATTAQRITLAADRLLAGTPHVSTTGALSANQLAKEAGVPRVWLYRQYDAERAKFEERVANQGEPPSNSPREEVLLDQIATLKGRISELEKDIGAEKERTQGWKEAAQSAFEIVNVLEKEAVNLEVRIATLIADNENLRRQMGGDTPGSRKGPSGLQVIPGKHGAPDGA